MSGTNSFPYYSTRISLREWHVNMLDAEGKACGFQRRSEFLCALVRRHNGSLRLERHPDMPKIEPPKAADLGAEVQWVWNIPKEIRPLMDAMAEQCDGLPAKAWVMILLFDWLGMPPVNRQAGRKPK